jgi:hypothetical protein
MLNRLINSFDNIDTNAFSARKLTGFAHVLFVAYLHTKVVDASLLAMHVIDACTLAVCLGLVTIPELIKFLQSNKQQ